MHMHPVTTTYTIGMEILDVWYVLYEFSSSFQPELSSYHNHTIAAKCDHRPRPDCKFPLAAIYINDVKGT